MSDPNDPGRPGLAAPTTPAARPVLTPRVLALVALCVAMALAAIRLFPTALPIIALRQELTRDDALTRASTFVRTHAIYDANAQRAVRFNSDDSVRTFLDFGAGGKDTLDSVLRGRDVAIFTWAVRFFVPRDPREAVVTFAPDGRLVGFVRKLADADERPAVSVDSARQLAETVLVQWAGRDLGRYRLATSSYDVKSPSRRTDRTFTFERRDRTLGGAPLRTDITIAGDVPSALRDYVVIPESFARRYGEMRASNDLLALLATVGIVLFGLVGVWAAVRFSRRGEIRWRPALAIGAAVGVGFAAAGLNGLPTEWFSYNTATSPLTFRALSVASSLLIGALMLVLVSTTLASAEVLAREAFPDHLDWWKLWRYRGTRQVAGRVFGGYGVAIFGFLYVGLFYLLTRKFLGWWVPSEMLDDPNLIATPFPWISGAALSLQAAIWEESLFRAIPLSALALWAAGRPRRKQIMAIGVVATALVFGFAHSNYASWPPYSRGIELFVDASIWAVLFLQFGLVVTVVAHFLYDLVLFGLFTATGSAPSYRVSLAIVGAIAITPALSVVIAWLRQGSLRDAPEDARFRAWEPGAVTVGRRLAPIGRRVLSAAGRRVAIVVTVLALIGIPISATRDTTSSAMRFTAPRARVFAVADSVLQIRGAGPERWTRLSTVQQYTAGPRYRFFRKHELGAVARTLLTSYQPSAAWAVRYVRTAGTASARAEEWLVRVLPDGTPLDVQHTLSEDAPGDSPTADEARPLARHALPFAGNRAALLFEVRLEQTPRPHRVDTDVEYVDSAIVLKEGASARVRVALAGRNVTSVRRFIRLPEAFEREDQSDNEDAGLVALVAFVVLFGATIAGIIVLTRQYDPLLPTTRAPGRLRAAGFAAIAALGLIGTWISRPASLFGYDTKVPWNNFITTWLVGVVLASLFLALIAVALLNASNNMRRRVGIPFWPDGAAPRGASDAVLAGSALALFPFAAGAFAARAVASDLPSAPDTVLNTALPWLSQVVSVAQTSLVAPPLLSLPLIVVAAFARGWLLRSVMLVTTACLVGALGTSSRIAVVPGFWSGAIATAIGLVIWAWAVRAWGTQSGVSWVIAALAVGAAAAAQQAIQAGNGTDRLAYSLGVATGVAAIAACYVSMRRRAVGVVARIDGPADLPLAPDPQPPESDA